MRLLHTETFRFEDFFDTAVPLYSILSHRWQPPEMSYQEFLNGTKVGSSGHLKILRCCEFAKAQGVDWVWIDTCCINKDSSAETSEAINSMFRWYRDAGSCYAYLSDVPHLDSAPSEMLRLSFRNSEWFSRGWTLQELLAPKEVLFLDDEWKPIGTRSDWATDITAVTTIEPEYLLSPTKACAAVKMSWISNRRTSRTEDMAYCMIGLFGINMPLLYGEGRKAFLRLQREIISVSDDETIFAWTSNKGNISGMLAEWPSCFAGSLDIKPFDALAHERKPYAITNKGLEIEVPVRKFSTHASHPNARWIPGSTMLLTLNCKKVGETYPLAIHVVNHQGNAWYRQNYTELVQNKRPNHGDVGGNKTATIIYVRQFWD